MSFYHLVCIQHENSEKVVLYIVQTHEPDVYYRDPAGHILVYDSVSEVKPAIGLPKGEDTTLLDLNCGKTLLEGGKNQDWMSLLNCWDFFDDLLENDDKPEDFQAVSSDARDLHSMLFRIAYDSQESDEEFASKWTASEWRRLTKVFEVGLAYAQRELGLSS